MDLPRQPRRRRGTLVLSVLAAILTAGGLSAAGFAARDSGVPTALARSVRTATVERGPMLREVEAPGSLVAEDLRWITASERARVDRIAAEPGTEITADTVIVELANPDLELQLLEAESELAAARAELANLEAELETEKITQQVTVATVKSERSDARRTADANTELSTHGNVARAELERSAEKAAELEERLELERRRLSVLGRARKAQISAQASRVDQLAAVVEFRLTQIARLKVTAGSKGVLREVPVELGQWVDPGTTLATLVQPDKLEAELRIPEVRAKDVRVGQRVRIDMRTADIDGIVSRIDPAVQGGTVTVDVRLEGPLPQGARPDLTVEGVIELEHIEDALQMRRPANVESGTRVSLFRLGPDGLAERTPVSLGRASMEMIEIVDGLEPGDVVIVSDTSAWDGSERLRIAD
jgi:multidrug efflux pump subunit AcrA (membrane-fusion protein)